MAERLPRAQQVPFLVQCPQPPPQPPCLPPPFSAFASSAAAFFAAASWAAALGHLAHEAMRDRRRRFALELGGGLRRLYIADGSRNALFETDRSAQPSGSTRSSRRERSFIAVMAAAMRRRLKSCVPLRSRHGRRAALASAQTARSLPLSTQPKVSKSLLIHFDPLIASPGHVGRVKTCRARRSFLSFGRVR